MCHRLIDYFSIYGLDLKNLESESKFQSTYEFIMDLSIKHVDEGEITVNTDPSVVDVELARIEDTRIILQVHYLKKDAEINEDLFKNISPISEIIFYYMPFQKGQLIIPTYLQIKPIPLKGEAILKKQFKGYDYYQGDFNLTSILQANEMETHILSLFYKRCTNNTMPLLQEIKVFQTDNKEGKMILKLPKGFKHLEYLLPNSKFLCYYQQENPLVKRYKWDLYDRFPQQDHTDFPLSPAVGLFCFPEGLIISREMLAPQSYCSVMTNPDLNGQSRIFIHVLVFWEVASYEVALKLGIWTNEFSKLYVAKAICIISHYPYLSQFKECLKQLYRLSLATQPIPIERILINIVSEVPVPDAGETIVQLQIGDKTIEFYRTPPRSPSYVDPYNIQVLFQIFSVQKIVDIFLCLLLERKILLISTRKSLLTQISLALESLLFPFRWEQVFIPVLPNQLKSYIGTIFPYIIGVHPSILEEVPPDTVRINIDQDKMFLTEPLPKNIGKPLKILLKRLEKFNNFFNPKNPQIIGSDDAFNHVMEVPQENGFNYMEVRDCFLQFLANLMYGYQRFLVTPEEKTNFTTLGDFFKIEEFTKKNQSEFLKKFLETSLFSRFIEYRTYASKTEHQIAYFDEVIKFKRSLKYPIFLLDIQPSKMYRVLSPYTEDIEENASFKYTTFPDKLNRNFLQPIRECIQLNIQSFLPQQVMFDDKLIEKRSDKQWSLFMKTSACTPRYLSHAEQLINLGIQVMDQVQEANEAIYRRLLEACGRCKLDVQAKSLFKKMKSQNIQPDAYTHSAYIQAMSLDLVQAPVVESKRSSLTPVKNQVFDIQTSLDLENIVFLSSDICPACCSLQTEEEIMSSFPKSFVTYTTKCSKCAGQYVPRFLVIQDVNEILEAEFLSPVVMYREIEHCLQSQKNEKFLITTSFRMNYRTLFWNLVLYFKLIKLPTFFLNPKLHMDEQLLQKTLEEITGVSKQSKTIQQLQLTPQPQVKEPSLESSFGFSEEEQNMDQSEQDQKTFFERKFNFLKGITNSKSESVSSEKSNNKSNSSQSEVSPKRKQIKKHMPISMRELRKVFGKEIQQFRFWNKVKCEIYNLEDLRAPAVL